MKQQRKLSVLAAVAVAMGLLLGASTAQAADVFLDGDTVTRIENLEVFDDQGGVTVYDVDFRFDTGFSDLILGLMFTGKTSTAFPS
jgi:hypothetical protein